MLPGKKLFTFYVHVFTFYAHLCTFYVEAVETFPGMGRGQHRDTFDYIDNLSPRAEVCQKHMKIDSILI